MLFQLAWNKVALGNLQFLGFGVAGQFDNFEPISQSRVNWFQPVRRRNEQNTRKIKRDVEIMIGERVVLRGIENFEQGCGRITAKISADLIQFVEQNYRIAAFNTTQGLDDAAGEGSDVGAAMAANLGF